MKKYTLLYDRSKVNLNIPEENVRNFIDLDKSMHHSDNNMDQLERAINTNSELSIDEFVKYKRVGVILADYTRKICFHEIIAAIFKKLKKAAYIKVFIATGTHESKRKGNDHIVDLIKSYSRQYGLKLAKVIVHSCNTGPFTCAGKTSNNNDIYVNSESNDLEVFITHSDMKNHYFAGYSNALKNFMPGICKYETIERNHALALDIKSTFGKHPLHPLENRRNNPLAKDIWEGYQLIVKGRPVYLIATIMKQDQIVWIKTGLLEKVTPEAILEVDKLLSVHVEPADHIIVSCGGYPNDESLYIAQRALELTKNGVKQGGDILFIAACVNGIGSERATRNFYIPLKADLDNILKKYQDHYVMFVHKTYKFVQLINKMRNIFVYSKLSSDVIRCIHLTPVKNIQHVVDHWIKENPKVKINIFPDANKFAVHAKI